MTRRVSIARMRAVARDRREGYLEAVWARATRVSDTHLELPDDAFRDIRRRYATRGGGTGSGGRQASGSQARGGPGTQLKSLLARIGIHASPTCKCNAMARRMDEWGPEESLEHVEEIVDVMQETARKRKLPFVRSAGRTMVRLACWKARRAMGDSGS